MKTRPPTAALPPEDYLKAGPQRPPRAVAEHAMAEVEDPANLAPRDAPADRLATLDPHPPRAAHHRRDPPPFDPMFSHRQCVLPLVILNHKTATVRRSLPSTEHR